VQHASTTPHGEVTVTYIPESPVREHPPHQSRVRPVIVVAEHRHGPVAGPHSPQRPDEPRGDLRRQNIREIIRGNQIPREGDEVRPFANDEPNGVREAFRRHPTVGMYVADLDDPVAVESPGQPRKRDLDTLYVHPPRLNPARISHAPYPQNPGTRHRETRQP